MRWGADGLRSALKLSCTQLQRQLRSGLAPVYLVAGDEPLLLGEALAEIRAAAREAGFEERELHVIERGFHWDELEDSARTLSLFATRKIVELRFASPRPGDAGARSLRRMVAEPDPDTLLVLGIDAKLDASAAKSVWVKEIEKAGALVDVRPIERAQLPRWIVDRAARYKLKLGQDTAEALAERVEGNLLAADQELRKLGLTAAGQTVDTAMVLDAVVNSARFDVFLLTDAVVAGNAPRALRILAGLRTEGVEPVLVSWALSRELSLLVRLKFAVLRGERLDNALAQQRVWRRRQAPLRQAVGRYEWRELKALLAQAVEVDAAVKGALGGSPWNALTRLVTGMLTGSAPARAA